MPCLPEISKSVRIQSSFISHYPRIRTAENRTPPNPSACEKILTEWFGQTVILLSSGRTGLHLFLRSKGFERYKHKLQVPKYLSRCVINALTPNVFPVELPAPGDGILFYHQYGFPQRCSPKNNVVIEDSAHAFFATKNSGIRQWSGEVGIFSLPKFFGIAGMAGGLVIQNPETAKKIREIMRSSPAEPSGIREWMRQTINRAYMDEFDAGEDLFVDCAYELLLKLFRPDPFDLVGFPQSIADICRIGEQRLERVNFFRSFFGRHAIPTDFWSLEEDIIPFALPYFGRHGLKGLEKANCALEENHVHAGIYHVDRNRDMYRPDYRPCLLLPCHQNITMEDFEMICQIVRDNDK